MPLVELRKFITCLLMSFPFIVLVFTLRGTLCLRLQFNSILSCYTVRRFHPSIHQFVNLIIYLATAVYFLCFLFFNNLQIWSTDCQINWNMAVPFSVGHLLRYFLRQSNHSLSSLNVHFHSKCSICFIQNSLKLVCFKGKLSVLQVAIQRTA